MRRFAPRPWLGAASDLPTVPTSSGPQNPTTVTLADASGRYTQAIADLATMATAVKTGDAALNAGTYDTAIQGYQQAGNQGAQVIGPEIDAAGAPNITQPYTQPAWQTNVALAAISSTGSSTSAGTVTTGTTPTQGDAESAQALAYAMLSYYEQAIQAGGSALTPVAQGGAPPGNKSALAVTALLSIMGGLGWVAWRAHHG